MTIIVFVLNVVSYIKFYIAIIVQLIGSCRKRKKVSGNIIS